MTFHLADSSERTMVSMKPFKTMNQATITAGVLALVVLGSVTPGTFAAASASPSALPSPARSKAVDSADPTANFVTAAYSDLLGRRPSREEAEHWHSFLVQGGHRETLATQLSISDEWVSQTMRKNVPDVTDKDLKPWGFVHAMQGGHFTLPEFAGQYYGSDDYFTKDAKSDNKTWVVLLYNAIVHRSPDPADLAYWTAQLDGGQSRYDTTWTFDRTPAAVAVRLTYYFQHFLGRTPTASETAQYSPMLDSFKVTRPDEVVAADLVSSDEYYQLAQTRTDGTRG